MKPFTVFQTFFTVFLVLFVVKVEPVSDIPNKARCAIISFYVASLATVWLVNLIKDLKDK